jgi:ArsR family transcriptional regulator, arsenate/arsenite/antimonite-responsive transcriptional repressor
MKMTEKKRPPGVDLIFKAFSDATRLRILHMLQVRELCVCDIVSVLGVPQPKVSRHLSYLKKCGLVRARKDGLWCYYQLAPAKTAFHAKMIECLACCYSDLPAIRKDANRLNKQTGCCG